jgi:uncharacterized protein
LTDSAILWRSLHLPGHEACRLFFRDSHWHLSGTAVFSHDRRPCRLDYRVVCDSGWRTRSGTVSGWLGETAVDIDLAVDPDHGWRLNGLERPAVAGCIDLDLNFSPSTNLIPIHRLDLAVGKEAPVNTAWLRFPTFELELLPQRYRRLDQSTYRYQSAGGFTAELRVNAAGFVVDYPGLWQAEESGPA